MAEHDTQPSKAEQRQLAVEKLRRAASLPRMKDGRRPPMHVEAVSEGEKSSPDIPDEKKSPSQSPPLQDTSPPQEPANEPEQEQEPADTEPDQDIEDRTVSPGPAGRSKRRSRSRSRSRGSKDFKNKARNAQSPIPPAGDSSQDDEEPPIPLPPIAVPLAPPILSPIPNSLSPFQSSHFLRSPTPDPSMFYPGLSPPTPMPLPTLEALQRGLFRSNSASSAAAGRRQALAKLTGGADVYDPSPSASPAPPFSNGGLSRNNTVAGGERIAARQLMLSRLNGRLAKEAEAEASGSEERGAPSPMPKKRRRRSRGNSIRTLNATGTLDVEDGSQPVDAPLPPHPFNACSPDPFSDLRAQSTTPMQTSSSQDHNSDSMAEVPPTTDEGIVSSPAGQARRRSILVEEDEDEDENIGKALNGEAEEQEEEESPPQQPSSQYRYPGLPTTPPRIPPHTSVPRELHSLDPPSQGSADSVPLIYNQRTPSRNDVFPKSPFNSPLKEKPSEEEEERVLYYHNTFRARTPFADIHTDGHGREISWVGDPVPIMVEDDSDEDDQDDEDKNAEDDDMPPPSTEEPGEEDGAFEEPLSPTSSDAPQKDGSFSPQPSSRSVHVESERSPEITAPTSSTPSSGAPVSTSQSIDESRMSPQPFPARLSIRSRTPGGSDKSPLPGDEWDEQLTSTKRNGEHTSPSTWDKLKGAFSRGSTGRRSRSNSLAARERRDNVDSGVSRESGASLTSAKNDKASEGGGQQPQALPVMQTPSASASILSLSPHTHVPTRGGASPIPPATTADFARYHPKLFPFPGIQKLEDQRNRVRAAGQASHSSPDVSTAVVDEDQPPPSAQSYHNTPALTPEPSRERKLSHQVSDSRLIAKLNGIPQGIPTPSLLTPSNSQGEYIDVATSPASSHNGKISKLPMTLPGVKQWLHNKKLFSSSSSNTQTSQSMTIGNAGSESAGSEKSKNGNKKPSLSDLLKRRGSADVTGDWEEVGTTPISMDGNFSFPSSSSQPSTPATMMTMIPTKAIPSSSSSDSNEKVPLNDQMSKAIPHADTEKTPKAKKLIPLDLHKPTYPYIDDSPSSLTLSNLPSRSDPLLSTTPDPTSSLSDYPLRSTSQSSSNSSRYSVAPQGSMIFDRIDENLVRGSKSPPFLASIIDDPPRKSVFTWPVYQVVNQKTVKDRFLFLFNDLLVVTKPKLSPDENLVEFKATPADRRFTVKNVVLLKDIRFTPGRTDPVLRSPSQKDQQPSRNIAIKGFVTQFAIDPEGAVKALMMKHPMLEDPRRLGQFLFQTTELDRARLGEILAKKMHKQELDAYLNCFGFVGVRVDKALRAFLLSVNVPMQNSSALDTLLDAFAGRWYDANARFVAFDKNMAIRLARALVRLNLWLHGDLAETPGPTGYPMEDFSVRDWIELIRRADPRQPLSTELLEDLYDTIRQEKLCQARCLSAGGPAVQVITIRKPVPSRLTYKSQSDPIILRIPAPDPHLTIHLDGQDLQFDPPVLNFVKSSEASFRIIGNELGLKTMIMCRSGPNALKYTGLPLSNTLVVERAFMRNTFQIAFTDHRDVKRRYMFSVADPVWALHVRTSIEQASSAPSSTLSASTENSKFLKVAEQVAFSVLQRTLIDGPDSARTNGLPAQNGHTLSVKPVNGKPNGFRYPKHARSKSRSQLYRHNAGQNELDLSYDSSSYNEFRDSDLSDVNDEEGEEQFGPVWSGEELVNLCQQNSTIPFVLSLLEVGVLGKEAINSP